MRRVSIIAIIGSCLSGVGFFFLAARLMVKSQSMIYVLSAGKVFQAFASDESANVEVDAKWQVIDFHEAFFDLDPDEKGNDRRLRKALYLADASAKREYDNLKESGYYSGIVSGNISQSIRIDSVVLRMNDHPFYFRCYATETITRSTSTVTRKMMTEGYLRRVKRSENCPHAFLIERWNILEYKDEKPNNDEQH